MRQHLDRTELRALPDLSPHLRGSRMVRRTPTSRSMPRPSKHHGHQDRGTTPAHRRQRHLAQPPTRHQDLLMTRINPDLAVWAALITICILVWIGVALWVLL